MYSLCLVLWARPLYSLEYKDSQQKEEVYTAKNFHVSIKEKTYSSSEPSVELSKLSIICLITLT